METNVIYCGDNLDVLPKNLPDGSVDLIYIDPPFNTSRQYEVFWGEAQERRAFEDRFGDAMTYLKWMRPRLRELHRVLKETGTFYYHCDWHASHYVKVELDRIFGFNNFQNEIIWKRTTAHADTHGFGHVHDIIFRYAKGGKPTFHREYRQHSESYLRNFFVHEDEYAAVRGKHRWDNLTGSGLRNGETGEVWRGIDPSKIGKGRHWIRPPRDLDALAADGRIYFPPGGGTPSLKRYVNELGGVPVDSIWDDVSSLGDLSKAKERLGYPTQKPVALLERIIKASSNQGDVVLDAFCGCGTTLEAAARLKRRWIGVDVSPTACRVMAERLENLGLREGVNFEVRDMPKSEDDLHRMPHFEFQNWAVIALGGIPNRVKVGDYGIDGRLYVADMAKEKQPGQDLFGEIDNWYPIQVKQKDKAGRPDMDSFETAMMRDRRTKGYFVAFGFSKDAETEIKRANRDHGLDIVPVTVAELLAFERQVA